MHARRTGWQRLTIIVVTLTWLAGGIVAALADSAPAPRPHAPISRVPEIPAADAAPRSGAGGTQGGAVAGAGDGSDVDAVAPARLDRLDDVTSIPVPMADDRVTVAYTVARGRGAPDAKIVTTRVADRAAARALVADLRARRDVAVAEVDPVYAALDDVPGGEAPTGSTSTPAFDAGGDPAALASDPERARQWGLDLLSAERTWSNGVACGQTIAVIDSGVDGDHPDLRGIVRAGKNMVSRGRGAVDRSGHGTGVAGVAAAAHDNARGISGMAPGVRVLPVGIEDAAGQMHASDLATAIRYAIARGATVINLSLGGPERSRNVGWWLRRAERAGIPVVAAAGNAHARGNPTLWPAAAPTTLAVGAVAPTGVWAPFSSTGAYVDVAAPGVAVLTTGPDGYVAGNGTSLAAPFVSATLALLRAADPDLTPAELRRLVTTTAVDVGPSGRDDRFGHGIVDPLAALREVVAQPQPCFTDVGDLTLAPEIQRLGLAGITDGCAVRRFCPARRVTRGQVATFVARVTAAPAAVGDRFDDDAGPHADGIERLAAAGIVQGCAPRRFCPDAPVTRAQMAAMIARALDLPDGARDAFTDDDGDPHELAIDAVAAAELTGGCGAPERGRFCPDAPVTRAQMAAFLARMMDHTRA